jgi:membrane protein
MSDRRTVFMSWPKRAAKLPFAVIRRFIADDAMMMASALSYTSLLSLVPLLAIGLAILTAFPTFESIRGSLQSTLVKILVPEVGQQVGQVIDGFIANAGKLTALGILGLVVTALLLLVTIEDALNRIFRVDKPRSPLSRLLVYWTVVTLGPILLGASLSISNWIFSTGMINPSSLLGASLTGLGALFRFAMLVSLFSLLYAAVPNRSVPVPYALQGGLLAAVVVAALRYGFHFYVNDFRPYQSVFGALAAVPVLLFWMYLVWVAVLAGAELTASLLEQESQ